MSKVVVAVAKEMTEEEAIREVLKRHGIATLDEAYRRAQEFKAKLESTMRQLWDTPEGKFVKDLMSVIAQTSGYAERVKAVMSRVADDLKRAAQETDLSTRYKSIFKPVVKLGGGP